MIKEERKHGMDNICRSDVVVFVRVHGPCCMGDCMDAQTA